MNPLNGCPFNAIGKSSFSTIVPGNRSELLSWWLDLKPGTWNAATKHPHSMLLLWMAERGLLTVQCEVNWYPPNRPPYCVAAVFDQTGPFQYLRFLQALGRLECVLPEWRFTDSTGEWSGPIVTRFQRNEGLEVLIEERQVPVGDMNSLVAWVAVIESAFKYDGDGGVYTGKGQSKEDALHAAEKAFKATRIHSVSFDGVGVHGQNKLSNAATDSGTTEQVAADTGKPKAMKPDEVDSDFTEAPIGSLTYGMPQLLEIMGADDNETARGYLSDAGLPVARGRGNRLTYTQGDAVRFAKQVIKKSSVNAHRQSAKQWLKAHEFDV